MKQIQADYRKPDTRRRIDICGDGAVEEILEVLEENGFCVVGSDASADHPKAAIKGISSALGLGEPVIPDLYMVESARKYSSQYHEIQRSATDRHPGFSTTDGQAWHVDGLLDNLGRIRTSVLYCVRPADAGGETLIFNAVAAFHALLSVDSTAADALVAPTALERRATILGVEASTTGPVFSVEADGSFITRFTDNDTCAWGHAADPTGALECGLRFLRAAAEDPRYRTGVALGRGEALVFRNDRVSHGRTAYQDSADEPRHLVRALYELAPRRTAA
ncbi:alpha-ketoglutarate-dependent taurine dioxygenase [Kitasatospora sp. MAA19]|uniref:TauD/TfdA family dioxygenase n=1 Tax=unclassified Kitasatospora TaxID=2633591 RepID=UPI002475B14A|nr:TauD/TfdA family dioxygenase [Kitasatospora sp. MAA19]MDH6709084.1 alpha-ketoglutarate-dependent taurine dioxygenase [Kitasatospora sp. MAA19]